MRRFLLLLFLFLLLPLEVQASPSGGLQDPATKRTVAQLRAGKAIAPASAPRPVREIIRAANRIRRKPYLWGGGHGHRGKRWPIDSGYDCSGSVSYALHGGGVVRRSRTSGGYLSWGRRGRGDWVTLWTNHQHVYMVVAGLRWDTSGGAGPRWQRAKGNPRGFRARHFPGL